MGTSTIQSRLGRLIWGELF